MTGAPVPVRVLCARTIANVSPGLSRALSLDPGQNSIALLATDCDDVTYLALDEATKAANVSVVYGRSLYAGAGNAPTPLTARSSACSPGRRSPTPAAALPPRWPSCRTGRASARRKTAFSTLPTAPRARGRTCPARPTSLRGSPLALSHRAPRPGPAGAGRRPEGRRRRACGILRSAHRNELCRSPAHRHPLGLPCRLHRLCRGGL